MPIRNIITDYSGRSKDINIFPTVNPRTKDAQPVVASFGPVSSYCAGVQKLIQRYTIALLTVKGSQPAYPKFGTNLLKQLAVSGIRTRADLTHSFNFANAVVIDQFRTFQKDSAGDHPDEELDTCVLQDVTVTKNYEVNYRVLMYTKAGAILDFLLPIPITK